MNYVIDADLSLDKDELKKEDFYVVLTKKAIGVVDAEGVMRTHD
jgi:hypothetical protein